MTQQDQLLPRYREAANAVVAELTRHPQVIGLALCGSLARGDLWEYSDLDMIVVMREAQVDWQALTVRHGDINVHLQILSEAFLLAKSEGFRGSLISQVMEQVEVVHDPHDIIAAGINELAAYPRDSQVHNAVKHLIAFLAEYKQAQRCLDMGHTEDAFLHINLAFRELAYVQYAQRGRYPQRAIIDELSSVAPGTYKAYVWFVYGRKNVGERIKRSFAFFEGALARIFDEIGPPLAAAIRSLDRPFTEEAIGEIPAIYDRSADLKLLLERMVQQNLIREDGRRLEIDGVQIGNLSETLFDLF